jgi:hypothetical protein
MGKSREIVSIWTDFHVCVLARCRLNSVELVKWADGEKTKKTQRELEISATDLAGGGSFLSVTGRGGVGIFPADGRGGCPAFPADANRAPGGSDSECDA